MGRDEYAEFSEGLRRYAALYERGLKKQANAYIADFVQKFEKDKPEAERDALLFRFCFDICDGGKFAELTERGDGLLPHALARVVWNYLIKERAERKMPQMRWIFQLFRSNPFAFAPRGEPDVYEILEEAYESPERDDKTAELWLRELLRRLDYGSHEFPACGLMPREYYEKTAAAAERVIEENAVEAELASALGYYRKLYRCYEEYRQSGGSKDFYKLCKDAGI